MTVMLDVAQRSGWLVILETAIENERFQIGIPADTVKNVILFEVAKIEVPPEIGISIDREFIQGVGKLDDGLMIIIDVDKVTASVHAGIFLK